MTDSVRNRLFIKAVKHLSMERVKEICAEYNEMRYPLGTSSHSIATPRTDLVRSSLGVIDLALACAAEWDSGDRAISYWLDGSPADDARVAVFDQRIACYSLVFDTLKGTDDLLNEAAQGKAGYSCSYFLPLVD